MILADYLTALPRLVTWVSIGAIWSQRTDRPIVPVVAAALAVLLELVIPIAEWALTRYRLDDWGIEQHTGMVRRRTLRIAWCQVKSLASAQSWVERMVGIQTISLKQESELEGHVKMRGATRLTVERINKLVAAERMVSRAPSEIDNPDVTGWTDPDELASASPRSGVRTVPTAEQPDRLQRGTAGGTLLFRAQARHLIVGALASGTVVVVAPTAVLALLDLIDQTPFGSAAINGLLSLPLPVAVILVVLVGLIGGMIVILVQRHGFQIEETDDVVTISHGWAGRSIRQVPREYVTGVLWTANPLEQTIGWAKLRLLTPESGTNGTDSASLPSLPIVVVERILGDASQTLLRGASDTAAILERSHGSLGNQSLALSGALIRILSIGGAGVISWHLIQAGVMPLWAGAAVGLALFFAFGALARLLSGRFVYAKGMLVHRSSYPSVRVTCQTVETLHGFSLVRSNLVLADVALVTATSFAGRRLNLRSLRTDLTWLDEAKAALLSSEMAPPRT
ncbi:MAG: PH domain-containing protein [Micropruina sp.]|nr:PH domain-containing protein [Micropruina sp.]